MEEYLNGLERVKDVAWNSCLLAHNSEAIHRIVSGVKCCPIFFHRYPYLQNHLHKYPHTLSFTLHVIFYIFSNLLVWFPVHYQLKKVSIILVLDDDYIIKMVL